MVSEFFDSLTGIYQLMRFHHVSYEGIASIISRIFPRGRDVIYNAFTDSIEKAEMPPVESIWIVHYDEQHPKRGRTQKYRLSLVDGITGRVIAEELHDRKDKKTIENFLKNT